MLLVLDHLMNCILDLRPSFQSIIIYFSNDTFYLHNVWKENILYITSCYYMMPCFILILKSKAGWETLIKCIGNIYSIFIVINYQYNTREFRFHFPLIVMIWDTVCTPPPCNKQSKPYTLLNLYTELEAFGLMIQVNPK